MPGNRISNSKKQSDINQPRLRSRWLWVGLYALLAALLSISYLDFHPSQNPDNFTDPSLGSQNNAFGLLGVKLALLSFYFFGGGGLVHPDLLHMAGLALFSQSTAWHLGHRGRDAL